MSNKNKLLISVVVAFVFTAAACSSTQERVRVVYADEAAVTAQTAAVNSLANAWDTGDVSLLDVALASTFERTHPEPTQSVTDVPSYKAVIEGFRNAYPDASLKLMEQQHIHDVGFAVWRFRGTNTGPGDQPPTGKPVDLSGVSVFRFTNGKITKEHVYFNLLDQMEQLGWTLSPPE